MTVKKILLLIPLLLIVAGYGFVDSWHVSPLPPTVLAEKLEPYFEISKPDGQGPFPTLLAFHGCSGLKASALAIRTYKDWAEYFVAQGWAVVFVDSLAARPVKGSWTCDGYALWGKERAGDVFASIEQVKEYDFVDGKHLALVGWSHGAWTVMDTLALAQSKELPSSLTTMSSEPLAGVLGHILFYPYCAYPALSTSSEWPASTQVLAFLGGKDTTTPSSDCLNVFERLTHQGSDIRHTLYPELGHIFDFISVDGDNENYHAQAAADARKQVGNYLALLLEKEN